MPSGNISVRCARTDDAGGLTDLCLRSKRSNGYDDAFMAACRAELTVTPEKMAAAVYWVAEASGVPCGCAALAPDASGTVGEVCMFFVDPDWQRQGVGRALWRALAAGARERGLTALRLDADPAAVPFYAALGFHVVGDAASGSIPGRRIPHMRLVLGDGRVSATSE